MSIPVHKTRDQIRAELFAHVNEVQEEYAAKGWLPGFLNLNKGVVRGLLELWCWGLWQLYEFLALVLDQAFPKLASASWLDRHADQLELPRRPATKARGYVAFKRTAATGNVKIPKGRVVKTRPDGAGQVYRYATLADVVLPDGQTEVLALVEAEEYGRAANASAGQICEMSTHVPGVTAVENRADWLVAEGADEESDRALRERYALAWQANNGVTKYAYASWALSVPGVIAVAVLDQHPRGQGTVDVVVKGAAGAPTQSLLGQVAAAVAGDAETPRAPINDDWLVKAPTAVAVAIEAELVHVAGDPATIQAAAEARVRALFTDPTVVEGVAPLQIGEDLTRDRLVAAIMAVSGVKRINWTSPAADVFVARDSLATLESLALSATQAEA